MQKTPISQQQLRELLHYEPNTGVFRWLIHPRWKGRIAGTPNRAGYIQIHIGTHGRWLAHHLATLYMLGHLPRQQVDHRNGIKSDNRWVNLREASGAINSQNVRAAHCDNKCGLLGVSPCRDKFRSHIYHDKRIQHLGMFSTAEEAHDAYLQAKRHFHPGCTI